LLSVDTVGGPIQTSDLGRVLMHEHVFVLSTEIMLNYPNEWGDEDARIDDAVRRLEQAKAVGIDSVLDLTVIGLGRYIPRIQRIAERTEVNILVATGIYTFSDLPFYFNLRTADSEVGQIDPMVEMFVRDIEYGIADTGVKAAVLKCATDAPGVTPGVERALRAVAGAHRHTGVPISTHTNAPLRRGLDQQRIFAEEGVDLTRVVIGHSGDSTDIAYLEELIANGSYIGMDKFGVDVHLPFEERVRVVAEMCARGHHGRMVLSHDAACHSDWLPEGSAARVLGPNWHYLHVMQDVVPALKARGVEDEQIDAMLIGNPRRIFEQQGPY